MKRPSATVFRSWQLAAHLQLIARKRRVGRTETQDIDDTTRRPGSHAAILVRQEMSRRELLRNLFQRVRINFLLLQSAKLLRQGLQALQQIGDGDGGPSDAPGERLIELETAQARRCIFRVHGLRGDGGALTSARGHRGQSAGKPRELERASIHHARYRRGVGVEEGGQSTKRWDRKTRMVNDVCRKGGRGRKGSCTWEEKLGGKKKRTDRRWTLEEEGVSE